MTRRASYLSPAAFLAIALVTSCSSPVAPDSFTLAIQIGRPLGMDRITLDNVDSLTLLFEPMMEGTARPEPADFDQPMMEAYADGQIRLSVDANGLLTMLISREYVVAHAVTDDTGGNPRLELELWTRDTVTHTPAPQIRGTVTHMGNPIGVGTTALAAWPLPPGGDAQLNIPCMTGMAMQCTAAP
jgi:hypothetical protein